MQELLISIIIPVFNRENIIKTTLDSIIAQTYTNWECILVDDGSIDCTKQMINSYINKNDRFRYFERPITMQKGANACRNFGFIKANGDYINWFDSDDIMEPNFLQEKINYFSADTDAVLHRNRYSNFKLSRFRESKFYYTNSDNLFYHYALDEIEIQTSGFMWKRKYLEAKLLFNESIQRFQDNEFHIRMLALKPEIKVIDKVLATIRGGDGDSTQISSKSNLSKKKLQDIFYFRYLTLKLNQTNRSEGCKEINQFISKKALWTFYTALAFDKNIFNRFNDLKHNYTKLKLVYSSKEFSLLHKIKSHLFLVYIVIFGNTFLNKK